MSLVILIAFVTTCSKEKNYTKETRDGIEYIENKEIPSNPEFNITLKKEFEVDMKKMKFENFINLTMDNNDNLYILTSRKMHTKEFIYKFDSKGKFINGFGKDYFDPSAFGGLINVKDTLFLFEPRYKKLIMFDLDGKLFAEKKFDTSKTGYPHKFQYLNENSFVIERSLTSLDSGITQKAMHIFDNKFNYIARFFALRHEDRAKIQYPVYFLKNDIYMFRDKKDYLIEVINDKGEKIREISKEFVKVKYTKKEIDDTVENYRKRFLKYHLPYDKAREMSIGLSDYKDTIINIFVDKNDRVWVQKFVEDYDNIYFDVFENGIFLNSIKLEVKIYNKLFFMKDRIYELKTQEGKIVVHSYE